jgi:serine/threonine protein kinase
MPVSLQCGSCQLIFVHDGSTAAPAACPRCHAQVATPGKDALVGRTIGGYRLKKRVGSGALSVVYLADHPTKPGDFAIKLLTREAARDEENGKRFMREAALCRQIQHPNVVAVHESGVENGTHFMAMDFVEGTTMEAAIDAQKRLPWRQVADLILQIGQALAHMERTGIIHRDIKPANILLTASGIAKLVDLGFAKRLGDDAADRVKTSTDLELTMQGVSMGSPAYMPPEQVLDAKKADATADVYSLGATFYHAVTGQTPFSGKSPYEVMEKVLKDPVPLAQDERPEVPIAISKLIAWTMDKSPAQRPRNATEFVKELEIAIFAPQDGTRIAALRNRRRPWGVIILIGGAAMLVLVGVAVLMFWLMGKH